MNMQEDIKCLEALGLNPLIEKKRIARLINKKPGEDRGKYNVQYSMSMVSPPPPSQLHKHTHQKGHHQNLISCNF